MKNNQKNQDLNSGIKRNPADQKADKDTQNTANRQAGQNDKNQKQK